ncbi:MAG: TonB-dependent copper receptor [Rhodospirillaceae bacterium]|nr:TonB-dependent copper receptor [Rhodospirillaceae bacterium]MBL6930807.1 TonB-dependent copper receptor [Rhodospirillales bacterium]
MIMKNCTPGKSGGVFLAVLLSSTAFALTAQAQETKILEGIVVEGQSLPFISKTELDRTDISPASDVGEFLRSLPGIDSVRMGGHGLDPMIRGQQQDQLNIISDGAFMYGGCPSRMDPPAALTALDSFDTITIERGYQSVTHGSGGTGGSIIMERNTPPLDPEKPWRLNFTAGGQSNDSAYNSSVNASYRLEQGYARANGTKSKEENYNDGAGKDVRSAFKQWSAGMEIGWTPNDSAELSLGVERDRVDDVLFAGAMMDSPYGVTDVYRLKFKKKFEGDVLKKISVNAYNSRVDHLMDSYTLRNPSSYMETPSDSDTLGLKIQGDLVVKEVPVVLGADFKNLAREAIRYRGTNATNVTTLQAYMWPDVTQQEVGVFGEGTFDLDEDRSVKVGLRYDNVYVSAGKTNKTASVSGAINRSANDLYTLYYGYGFENVMEHNVSGLMRFEQKIDMDTSAYATLSRSVRTANTTERAIAADHAMNSMRRAGNPRLDPEQHYQADVGISTKLSGYAVSASAYYDRVNDFIFRDAARGQSGILLNDTTVVYRNIDANLMGFGLAMNRTFENKVSLAGSLTYTRGENKDINAPLAQIPPLKMTMDASYPVQDWLIGARANAVARQGRVDDDSSTGSGRDTGKTGGYVTADLYASRSIYDNFELGFGVSNLLDKKYANHLNTSSSFDATETQVNEPGRSFYLRLTGNF